MPLIVKNDLVERKPSKILKLENGDKIILQSHLVKSITATIQGKSGTVFLLHKDGLEKYFKSYRKRVEYFYFGKVNDNEGMIRLPASVFFSIQQQAKVLGKTPRSFEWVISKTGSGLETKYTVTRMNDVDVNDNLIQNNTDKLFQLVTTYEEHLGKTTEELEQKVKERLVLNGNK